jgi:hypothetical protein
MNDGSTYDFNRKELENLDIEDEKDDIIVKSSNFRYDDYVLTYKGTFRDEDNNRFEFSADVVFKDGEFDTIKNIIVIDDN